MEVGNLRSPPEISGWSVVGNGEWKFLYSAAFQVGGGFLLERRTRFNILFKIPRPFKSVSARRSGTLGALSQQRWSGYLIFS